MRAVHEPDARESKACCATEARGALPGFNVSFLAFLGKGEQFPRVICILAPSCSHYKYSLY